MADEQEDKTETQSKNPERYLTNRVMIGAMIAINVIILQALISFQKLDDYLHNSAIAIAIALSCLVTVLLLHDIRILFGLENKTYFHFQSIRPKIVSIVEKYVRTFIILVATFFTLDGLGNALYHVAPDAGAIFVGVSVVLYLLLSYYSFFLNPQDNDTNKFV